MDQFRASVTEMLDFMRCRRMWNYVSKNRMHLQPVVGPNALSTGVFIHRVLELQVTMPSSDAIVQAISEAWEDYLAKYQSAVGTQPAEAEIDLFSKSLITAQQIVQNYFRCYGENTLEQIQMRYEVAESDWELEIAPNVVLTGKFDGVLTNDHGHIWLIDHKTYSGSAPDVDQMHNDFQFNVYVWAARQLFGRCEGLVYDGILKSVPSKPKLNSDGKSMSRQLIKTTRELYLEALLDAGLDPEPYQAHLEKLPTWNDTFKRVVLQLNPNTKVWASIVAGIIGDMQRAILYPNLRWEGCWDCSFKALCNMEQHGLSPTDAYMIHSGSYIQLRPKSKEVTL